MITIDTKGKLCPAPLIMVKKELKQAAPGETIAIVTDNDTACSNLIGYLAEMQLTPEIVRSEGFTTLTIVTPEQIGELATAECNIAAPSHGADYAVVVKSLTMGDGDPELGRMLLRAFINSLTEADRLPSTIVLYNDGVRIALEGSDTAATLQELEQRGVSVLVCGTCVDFYGLKQSIAVGMISNMYKITKVLSSVGHVIYP